MVRGYCLSSQSIRKKVNQGEIVRSTNISLVASIQPNSFDTLTADEVFVLDTDIGPRFEVRPDQQVYGALLQLTQRQRKRCSTHNGFELKRGSTYLLPLQERVALRMNEWVKSSTKSSLGRLFPDIKLIADYSSSNDEFYATRHEFKQLWLMVTPQPYNLIVHPDVAMTQLRFMCGDDAQLSAAEVRTLFSQQPFLFDKDGKQTSPTITDHGLQGHLDGVGKNHHGVIALRTRNNPDPIDLSLKGKYDVLDFFDPVLARDQPKILPGEYMLAVSQEAFHLPAGVSIEIDQLSHVFPGPNHFAGFIDASYRGDIVYEIRNDGTAAEALWDGKPMCKMRVFRTDEIPDLTYGESLGSHYLGQIGPRVSKHFSRVDYKEVAKEYKSQDRLVGVVDANKLLQSRLPERAPSIHIPRAKEGFSPVSSLEYRVLQQTVQDCGRYAYRYDCEKDEALIQPIAYVLVFGFDGVLTYRRSTSKEHAGDERLFGKRSIGIGGHIEQNDQLNIDACMQRVLASELQSQKPLPHPELLGTLLTYREPVDRVHLGFVYGTIAQSEVNIIKENVVSEGFVPFDILSNQDPALQETWTRMLVPELSHLYGLTTKTLKGNVGL